MNSFVKFMIHKTSLEPIVYTTVEDSGVALTIRFLCEPRQRREIEQDIWESILLKFKNEMDIDFAYPTVRRFMNKEEKRICRYISLQAIYAYEVSGEQDVLIYKQNNDLKVFSKIGII